MEKNEKIRIYFVIFIIFIIGIFIGFMLGLSKGGPKSPSEPEIQKMISVSGSIKSIDIGPGKLTIQSEQSPTPENLPQSREILISQNTRIVRIEEKEKSRFESEYQDYLDNLQSGNANINPPISVIETEISLGDLKIGDKIIAFADHDIKDSRSFEAVEIELGGS